MFLRNLPKFSYSGMTIIMSIPSRHDRTELLSGVAGFMLNEFLSPENNIYRCDVRLIDDPSPLLKDTKVILLLGAKAFRNYTLSDLTLDEGRGSPYNVRGIICIPSFSAQDAVDPVDYETRHNILWQSNLAKEEFNEEESESEDDVFESKGRGKTKRKNYRFWLKQDIKKALRILNNNGNIPKLYGQEPTYIIAPDYDTVIASLDRTSDTMFYDCETDFISYHIRCISYSFHSNPFVIYVVPFLDVDYNAFYENQQNIFKAFANCIRNNTVVAHNGMWFDYLVLALLYRIPIKHVYDSLIAQHRIYPTIEKSLGHCVSLATYEPFHKNEGVHGYYNRDQADQLYRYCGKDVFTMYLVWKWQTEMSNSDSGIKASIKQAQDSIVPYLTACLLGTKFNEEKRRKLINEDDNLMMQYMRVMRCLTGPDVAPLISNQKCAKYFHEQLNYKAISRTKAGKPSLAKDNLLKLGMLVNNPVVKFLIKYREVQKETGTLNFKPWIDRKGECVHKEDEIDESLL